MSETESRERVEHSASRAWLDKFGESANGKVSWHFATAFAEEFAEKRVQATRERIASTIEERTLIRRVSWTNS